LAYKDADSRELLRQACELLTQLQFRCINIDATIIAQEPKMAQYIEEIRLSIASILKIGIEQVNVKATTTEKLGFTGRGEGIAAEAVVLIENDEE
ncbi:MAG TPA: 2-C-methyl-D-erythritol 2,4-cyclodiphosphate synthase, partial [Bacillales bacterium]|nr:2-C-methyl-D-erythritol 2,4-cyclodiphosphate synthase [Bacillales bacterium]